MELVNVILDIRYYHRPAIENAIRVQMATGASTNVVIHLIAIARARVLI